MAEAQDAASSENTSPSSHEVLASSSGPRTESAEAGSDSIADGRISDDGSRLNSTPSNDSRADASRRELIFVDTGAENYQQLVDDLLGQSDANRAFEVVLLQRDSDGIQQITAALAEHSDLAAMHIVTHGNENELTLGNVRLTANNLAGYSGEIANWGGSFSTDADILLYGCGTASSLDGQVLVQSLSA